MSAKNKTIQMMDQLDNLEFTRDILNQVTLYRVKLIQLPLAELNNAQKIWLLAFDASESKLATNSKESIVENLLLLKDAIPV